MQYVNDVHNRLYRIEGDSAIEVFSGEAIKTIDFYVKETENPQRYITDAIMIFLSRKHEIEGMLWSVSGGAYYQDLQKIEKLSIQIDNANKELKLL